MDLGLIKKLLIFIEENEKLDDVLELDDFIIPNYSKEEIYYHLRLLGNAEYIDYADTTCIGNPPQYGCSVEILTYKGHEYIKILCDDTLWAKAEKLLKEAAVSIPLDTLKSLSISTLKEIFGNLKT